MGEAGEQSEGREQPEAGAKRDHRPYVGREAYHGSGWWPRGGHAFARRGPRVGMLGLRYVACEACDTVSATPTVPHACPRCGAADPTDITDRLLRPAYFVDD
ncbi:hypothetical protein GCM10027355_09390 [Haloplanus salinarum]